MSDLYSRTDLFSEFDRLQRQMTSLFGGLPSSIRAGRLGAFPQGQHWYDRRLHRDRRICTGHQCR